MAVEKGLSILELLRMPLSERRAQFDVTSKNRQMDVVIINSNIFTNYGSFSFAWKKSYLQDPERSASGSIEELENYSTYITPQLTINFSIMSITDYRRLAKLYKSRNAFTVTCYDVENDEITTNQMYFAPNELPKLRTIAHALSGEESWVELLGVDDLTVEMIGTNVGVEMIDINYDYNIPEYAFGEKSKLVPNNPKNQSVLVGSQATMLIGGKHEPLSSLTFGGKYKFKYWQDEQQFNYVDGGEYIFNKSTKLKAIWEKSAE